MTRKRALDLTLTVLGAIAWVPVVLMGALLVLVTSGRPVFYRSNRRVSTGHLMRVVKFRTMVKNADKIANRETLPVTTVRFLNIPTDSPLYTRAGRLLERCGVTELPQFVHVLTGRMSIVGNRPLPDNVLDCLREEYSYADDRFLTPAGLTGPAQLVGRDALTDDERLRLESAYCRACVHSYSMWLDLSILLYTVLIVVGVKKSLDYQGVLDFIDRRSKTPKLVEQAEPALPESETSGLVVE
jgi:lipopolysaccharide/colanic/teichoic acid biosynthesis glycosyltransferase